MTVREDIEHAILSRKLEHVSIERAPQTMDVDTVGAFGLGAGKLTQYLIRWSAATEELERNIWLKRSWRLLVRRTAKDLGIRCVGAGKRDYGVLERVCLYAMHEWANSFCEQCKGLGKLGVKRYEVKSPQRSEIICEGCKGVGVKRYSDADRIAALQLNHGEYKQSWEKRLSSILVEISKAFGRGMTGTKERLA